MAYTSNAEATPVFKIPPPTPDPTLPARELAPAKLDLHEKSRVSAAAHRAKRLYPGVVGEVLFRELDAWASWGYRLDQTGLMPRLADHIMTASEQQ